jgi:MATE family multidrug resistance protein
MNPEVEIKKAPKYWDVVFHSVLTFLGQQLMQVTDLIFCRDLGSLASATIGTATAYFAWFMILGYGLISSLEFLIPNALGEKNERSAHEYFNSGLFVIGLLTLISTLGLILAAQFAPYYGMNPEIVKPVQGFSRIISLSYLPVFLVPLFRIELQARGYPNDTTIAFVFGNILNVFLNWVLVLGHLGCPAYGVMGSAWANVLSRLGIFLFLWFRLHQARKQYSLSIPHVEIPYALRVKEIIKLGAPASLHMMFEVGAFVLVSILASRLTASQNAAHAIAISIASFVFMIPAGMSSAAALTMARALGERKQKEALELGSHTIRLGLIYAAIGSILFSLLRQAMVHAYTEDAETQRIGESLILVMALFQFGDAQQVILAGCLRGLGETRTQAIMTGIGHWLIGVPIGILLGFYFGYGIIGLWVGLSIGLFMVAGLLYFKYRNLGHGILESTQSLN